MWWHYSNIIPNQTASEKLNVHEAGEGQEAEVQYHGQQRFYRPSTHGAAIYIIIQKVFRSNNAAYAVSGGFYTNLQYVCMR